MFTPQSTMSTPKVGLFAPLPAKDGKATDLSNFLLKGHELLEAEPLTLQWYAIKYTGEAYATKPTFAIFDTFAADEGRNAHVTGEIAKALLANQSELLGEGWKINPVQILASKVQKGEVSVGLRLLAEAKPEKVEEVKEFLISAIPAINDEVLTLQWYAIQIENTNTFGILDFSAGEEGRQAHLTGAVAKALFSKVDELFVAPPELVHVDVVASRVL